MTKENLLILLDYKKNHSIENTAVFMGLSQSTVRYWLKRAKAEGISLSPNQKPGRKPLSLK